MTFLIFPTSSNKENKKNDLSACDTEGVEENILKNDEKNENKSNLDNIDKFPIIDDNSDCTILNEDIDDNLPSYIPEWIVESAKKLQITKLSQIQRHALPLIYKGSNVIASAPTGTGKTICFCWPILSELSKSPYGVFALVLVPNRELALQVADQFTIYGSPIGASVVTVIGGTNLVTESSNLCFRPNIVVATPGRLAYHLRTPGRSITDVFSKTKYLVLDEADNLLSPTFEDDLITIISCLLPVEKGRRTLLFSATINNSIESMHKMFESSNVPVRFIDLTNLSIDNISHYYIFYPQCIHLVHLNYILKLPQFLNKSATDTVGINGQPQKKQGILFVATKKRCIYIEDSLKLLGFKAVGLHSLLTQKERSRQLEKFKSGKAELLIATNIASRGLDIPKVAFVINLDICLDIKDYTHRIGRTGRAYEKGIALSFVDERDVSKIEKFENILGFKLNLFEFSEKESLKSLNKVTRASQRALVRTEMTLKHKFKVKK